MRQQHRRVQREQLLRTPDAALNTTEDAAAAQAPDCGLILAPVTAAARRYFHLSTDQGVVVSAVDPTSEAFASGITPGDVIEQVQNAPVDSPDQVMGLINQAQESQRFVALLVARKTSQRWIALSSPQSPTMRRRSASCRATGR